MKKLLCLLTALCLLPCSLSLAQHSVTVVASFYPVYIMAKNVLDGVEGVDLAMMTAPSTGCLHDYQLLTSDMRTLSRAQLFLINGAGMETFLPDVQAQFPHLPIADCSSGVPLLCGEEEHDHDHDHDHDHGEFNAHIWLNPKNAIIMTENIAAALSALLPGQAEKIQQNAALYSARLRALDQELAALISSLPRKEIVTFHESFPYFAEAYGLQVVAVVALEPDAPLSPRMVKDVVEKVQAAGNPPLFAEPQYRSAALQAISQETGAPVFTLDPMVTGDGSLTAYEDAMRRNGQVLSAALGR